MKTVTVINFMCSVARILFVLLFILICVFIGYHLGNIGAKVSEYNQGYDDGEYHMKYRNQRGLEGTKYNKLEKENYYGTEER